MSTQYVGCDCLVYESNCQGLVVGHEFKKLLPVYSTPSTYSYRYRIPNEAPTATSVFTSRPISSTYLQWVDNTLLNSLTRSSFLSDSERVILGSPQLTFRVDWRVSLTGESACPPSGKLTLVVPEGRTNRAHEPWDIKGRRIVFKLPRCRDESTSGSFAVPGLYRSFLVHTSPDLSDVEVEFKITSYFKPPETYAPGEFYVKDCNGSKLLAYTNTRARGQVVTREPSSLLATFSRIVMDEYKSRTYYTRPEISDDPLIFDTVPNTTTVLSCESTYKCDGTNCAVVNGVPFNWNNVHAPYPPSFRVLFGGLDDACRNMWGITYAQPSVTIVSKGSDSSITSNGQYFRLELGSYYRIELEMLPGGMGNGKDSYGQGISWDDSVIYSTDKNLSYGPPTSLVKQLIYSTCIFDSDGSDVFVFSLNDHYGRVKYYNGCNGSKPPPPNNGYVEAFAVPDGAVSGSTKAPSFSTPSGSYNFVIRCDDKSALYYPAVESCLSRFGGTYYSPLSEFKLKVTVNELKIVDASICS